MAQYEADRTLLTETDKELDDILRIYINGGFKDNTKYVTRYDSQISKMTCDINWYNMMLSKRQEGNHKSVRLQLRKAINTLYVKRKELLIKRNNDNPQIEPLSEKTLNSHQFYQTLMESSNEFIKKAEFWREYKCTKEELVHLNNEVQNWYYNASFIINQYKSMQSLTGPFKYVIRQYIQSIYDQESLFSIKTNLQLPTLNE